VAAGANVCEPATCSIGADGPLIVCPGKSFDFEVTAICETECATMTVTVEVIGKEYALLAIVSVNPGSVPCGPFKTPVTLTIDMDEDAPLGQFTVDLRGEILDDGLVVCETTLSLPVTVDLGVTTLTADPTSIPATTAWPGMPPYNLSNIDVQWEPPDCEGRLEIVQIDPIDGYTPPNSGTIEKIDNTFWRYTSFDEFQGELCPGRVKVWLAAVGGTQELQRISLLVLPVHTWWTTGHKHGPGQPTHPPDFNDFANDYNFLRWKYAAVLATTGGAFTTVSISSSSCVPCGLGLPPPCVYACTSPNMSGGYDVVFGTSAFTGSENQAASIIGHELVHTTVGGSAECTAYRWEAQNCSGTGVCLCDGSYLQTVLDYLLGHSCP